jgi:hypothetical protein
MLQKKLGEHSGAGTDVGNDKRGSKSASLLQKIDDRGWIAGTKRTIRVNATTESFLRIGIVSGRLSHREEISDLEFVARIIKR